MRQVDHRVQDRRRRDQRHRDRGAPSRSAGSRNTTSTANATTMPTSARSPRHRATATTTTANAAARAISGQCPLVSRRRSRSWCRSGRPARLIRMSSPTARLGWPGPAAELQQRVGALVRSGVDRYQRLHAMAVVALAPVPVPSSAPRPPTGSPHGAALLDSTCPASVVTAPPAAFWKGSGMSTFCWLGHSHTAPATTANADGDQQTDDDPWRPSVPAAQGRAGSASGRASASPGQGRGSYLRRSYWR